MFLSKIKQDITNLYSSRDSIWNVIFRIQSTSQRRDKDTRQRLHRLHRLERRLKLLEGNKNGKS